MMNVDCIFGFDLYRTCPNSLEEPDLLQIARDNLESILEGLEKDVKDFCNRKKSFWYEKYCKNRKYVRYIEDCIKKHISTCNLVEALSWKYTNTDYELVKAELLKIGIKYVADYFYEQSKLKRESKLDSILDPFSCLG